MKLNSVWNIISNYMYVRRVWRYQRGKSKDRQPNDQKKNNKQRSTKHYTEN